jgi:hypothetical protein
MACKLATFHFLWPNKCMKIVSVFLLGAILISGLAFADAFVQKVSTVMPGMSQAEVVDILGEPQALASKSIDVYGQQIEVWRYTAKPAFVYNPPVIIAISTAPASIVSKPSSDTRRIQNDLKFWSRVQKSAVNNPADAGYKPVITKREPAPSAVPTALIQSYFITFANGVVQAIQLSEI